MKVRFYRGPMDGKVREVRDSPSMQAIETVYRGSPNTHSVFISATTLQEATKKALYYRTQHTHPDGSVYFEWSKPKGTKL